MSDQAVPRIELLAIPHIPLIQPGDDLPGVVLAAAAAAGIDWRERDVLVLAQKIVSKAEGRLVYLPDVKMCIRDSSTTSWLTSTSAGTAAVKNTS